MCTEMLLIMGVLYVSILTPRTSGCVVMGCEVFIFLFHNVFILHRV